MKTHSRQSQKERRTLVSNLKSSRQAPIDVILQMYASQSKAFQGKAVPRKEEFVQRQAYNHSFPKGNTSININEQESQSITYNYGDGEKKAPSLYTDIKYTPLPNANDADPIRLIQVVRTKNSSTGELTKWSGEEERREKTKTKGTGDIEEGWFVDHQAGRLHPRSKHEDSIVPDAYIDVFYAGDETFRNYAEKQRAKQNENKSHGLPTQPYVENFHGKKKDTDITSASLNDSPASNEPYDFKAEVQIKGKEGETENVYGNIKWGFKTKKEENKLVMDQIDIPLFTEHTSPNFLAAVSKFNEIYRNPDSEVSPENIAHYTEIYKDDTKSLIEKIEAKIKLAQIYSVLKVNALTNELEKIDLEEAVLAIKLSIGGWKINKFTKDEDEEYMKQKGKHIKDAFPEANVEE